MTRVVAESSNTILLGTELPAIALALAVQSLSAYMGWKALSGDEQFALVQQIAITLAALGSATSFQRERFPRSGKFAFGEFTKLFNRF